MFVVSISKSKIKKSVFVATAVLVLSLATIFSIKLLGELNFVQIDKNVIISASDSQERLSFISQFGWDVDEEPVEVREVVIPEVFDDVYINYNEIQLKQGFDLSKYAGQRVKKWTYIIRNYPDTTPEDDYIRLNLLVCDGEVIGGDICSVKLDGFMHGFDKE